MLYERITLIFGLSAITGGAIMIAAIAKAGAMYSSGLVLIVLGALAIVWFMLTRQFREVTKPADDAYQLGYQLGYDKGYLEGHATARPVVVPIVGALTCLHDSDARLQDVTLN